MTAPWGVVAAAIFLFVVGVQLALWSCWTFRGLPSPWADLEGYRAARHTAEGRMLLALLSVTAGLALIGLLLAFAVTAFAFGVLAGSWVSSHPARYARDRPPDGDG
jgi:hypothetical protein